MQHLNGRDREQAPCGRGWCRRSFLRPRPKEKEYTSYHTQTVPRKEGSYLCCKGKTLKVQDLLEEEKNFRKSYIKALSFLSIHMGVKASVLPGGTDCHRFILVGLSRKDYEQKKELVANEIIGRLEKRLFPGLQDSIVLKEPSQQTPQDIKQATNLIPAKRKASKYTAPATDSSSPKRAISHEKVRNG